MVLHRLNNAFHRLPISDGQKVILKEQAMTPMMRDKTVFLGVSTICALCAIPVLQKNRAKPGHGLFDSEKPQEVELAQEEARRKKLNVGDRSST